MTSSNSFVPSLNAQGIPIVNYQSVNSDPNPQYTPVSHISSVSKNSNPTRLWFLSAMQTGLKSRFNSVSSDEDMIDITHQGTVNEIIDELPPTQQSKRFHFVNFFIAIKIIVIIRLL